MNIYIAYLAGAISLGWQSQTNHGYRIFATRTLDAVPWMLVTNIVGNGSTQSIKLVVSREMNFYRVEEWSHPLYGKDLYVEDVSNASRQADLWRSTRPSDAAVMDTLAATPEAVWILRSDIQKAANHSRYARDKNQTPVLVAYNIVNRDCGGLSGGGATSDAEYLNWAESFASVLATSSVILLEPDSLAGLDCLSLEDETNRFTLVREASRIFEDGGHFVFQDGGHARWQSVDTMVSRLRKAGVTNSHGFFLNVANFIGLDETVSYGLKVSSKLGGLPFVIDTSRNGKGPPAMTGDLWWCNPPNVGRGRFPTAETGNPFYAYLFVKRIGESDGSCHPGDPPAGSWMPEYALKIMTNVLSTATP